MDVVNRSKSIIKTGSGRWLALVLGAACCVGSSVGNASAQTPGLSAPQKQAVTFTFGLGSSELSERYGQNVAAMEKFTKLIGQVAETPSANIDSVVIVANSSTADQLGTVEIAQRRVQAVRGFVEPVIRGSQLRQTVTVTGHVVSRNNVFAADQIFDMLKKVSVTVYLNGLTGAGMRTVQTGPGSAAEEEQRYISPFGGGDVFGRHQTKKGQSTTTTTTVTEMQAIVPAAVVQKPVEVAPQQKVQPVVPVTRGQYVEENTVSRELQRFIDSLSVSAKAQELAPIAEPEVKQPEVKQPTAEEPCPEDRDPEIDEMIRRLLAEQAAGGQGGVEALLPAVSKQTQVMAPVDSKKIQVEEVGSTSTGRVSDSKKSAIIEYEISGSPQLVSDVADAKKIKIKPVKAEKAEKVKPVKTEKVKPVKAVEAEKVKPVKAAHEPMTLPTPIVAVKTNLLYWAGAAANLEAEVYFAKRWSAMVEGVYTTWDMNLYKKNYAVNEISPEVRYWLGKRKGQYRGLYVGVYGHIGQFDYMFKDQDTGNTGDYYGGGISLGAYLPFTRHFGMELGLRGGFVHASYDRYYEKCPVFMYRESGTTNYFGLTGAKVSLVYRFGLPGGRK